MNNLREDRVLEFWSFVIRRHDIYYRRFVLGDPPPWTSDEILRKYHFTNVYRELDRGTIYLIENIVPVDSESYDSHVIFLFNTLLYRCFNWPPTHTFLVHELGSYNNFNVVVNWDEKRALLALKDRNVNRAIQKNAYTLAGLGGALENRCKTISIIWDKAPQLTDKLVNCKGLQQEHAVISTIPGFGDFMSYEIVIDLNYSRYFNPFSEDDWVSAGPGCRRGLTLMLQEVPKKYEVYTEAIKYLRYNQGVSLEDAEVSTGMKWRGLKELTLRNVEHSLCEFYKYDRILNGGWAKRGFKPHIEGE